MNLNKWLCKTFDIDKKGYVTIADVLCKVLEYGFYIIITTFMFVSVGILLSTIQGMVFNNGNPPESIYQVILFILEAYKMPFIVVVILVTSIYILYKISQIKIAKCPLKENENK